MELKMNRFNNVTLKGLALASTLLTFGAAPAFSSEVRGYAEALYSDYAAFSGDEIAFSLVTKSQGIAKGQAHSLLRSFIMPASYNVKADHLPNRLQKIEFEPFKYENLELFNKQILKEYQSEGFPSNDATYRILVVQTRIGTDERSHEALELCWKAQDKCTVIDAGVDDLESAVMNIRRIRASGSAPTVDGGSVDTGENGSKATTLACRTVSDPTVSSRTWTVPAEVQYGPKTCGVSTPCYSIEIPRQQMGIRCVVDQGMCVARPWAESSTSKFVRNRGNWSFHCDGKGYTGSVDSNTKTVAVGSGCGVKAGLNVDVSFSIKFCGSGASLSVCPSSNGTKYYAGRDVIDSCAYTAVTQ